MTSRKFTPLHDKWHPRVEGQIRDVMHHHPKWFSAIPKNEIFWFVNSLAKRIVGEIVAEATLATKSDGMDLVCNHPMENDVGVGVTSSVAADGTGTVAATEIPNGMSNGESH